METVAPGFDDRKITVAPGRKGTTVIDRQEGRLYMTLWEQAIADGPDWVLIDSFNQWHSGTEIEPSVEMGDRYLTLTEQYSSRFRQAAQ